MSTLITNTLQGINTIKYDANTTAMTIDSNGVVSNSTRVWARGHHTTPHISSSNYITFNGGKYSSGGVTFVDSDTGMQVPVDGLYLVGFHALGNSGSGNLVMQFRKNGGDLMQAGNYVQDNGNNNDDCSATTVVELSANDKVQFYVVSGASHGNASYNNFWCTKIG